MGEHLKGIHDETLYTCSLCPHKSKWYSNILNHEKVTHNIKNQEPKIYTKKNKVKNNSNEISADRARVELNAPSSKCPKCSLKFQSKHSMKIHFTNKHFRKCYQCSVCMQKFVWKPHYNKHLIIHTKACHIRLIDSLK